MVGCQEATSVLWGWKKDWKWAFFKCCKSRGRWEEDRLFALIGGSSPSLSRGIDSLYCFICEKPGRFFFSCPTKCARAACKLASSVESKVTRLTVACPTSYRQMWQSKKRKQSSVSRWMGWWIIWFSMVLAMRIWFHWSACWLQCAVHPCQQLLESETVMGNSNLFI